MKPLSLLCVAALAACGANKTTESPTHAPQAVAVEEPQPIGESIYDLPVELRGATDQKIGIDVAKGHPVLISMFYASCPVACPVLIEEIKKVLSELPTEKQAETRIVLISFDAARDTPAKLRDLAAERELDDRWILASAAEPDARSIAAVLGVKYRKLDSGEFFHGSTIVALDRNGRPIARTDALGKRATLVSALK